MKIETGNRVWVKSGLGQIVCTVREIRMVAFGKYNLRVERDNGGSCSWVNSRKCKVTWCH